MLRPKFLLIFFLAILAFTWLRSTGLWKRMPDNAPVINITVDKKTLAATALTSARLKEKAGVAAKYAGQNGFNTEVCFLADMSLHSGRDRFVVYDLKKDSIIRSGLVTHGRCNQNWLEGRKYGNTVGCGCTSLGKYRIGNSYKGRFGLAYKLYGLEKTNDKAFERFVVLHSHECVPSGVSTEEICQSDGCPTVSPGFLQYLSTIINASRKPVMLWIYD